MTTTEPLHRQLGLTDDELSEIIGLLGREPTELELAMYAVMWSEHCSYKSSIVYRRRFPTEAPWVLVGPGEGAGVIDVGDGLAVALRIESHNHPSAVEPYEGRRHRRRRDHPRRLLDGRAAHRTHGSASFRPARRPAHPLSLRARRRRYQRLRQCGRRSHRRWRGRVRRVLPRQPARERALSRACCRASVSCSRRPRVRETSRC